ncbi:LysR family transcriptional regulator [Francisella adeliensis]|uniref:LysR family transcriptional regulator n=1 Tax=Francisella adeliensis TaxID=2007306 RepID=A0A2Z4Y195_9GAMM|nr:LysR family transcriptional regulator [Francisella adeliensis]AXA34648.1 hypothetical protein CDH04_09670 [Francisella adeliensis]MBK2086375.1 LysR family transcriptional regulator [Francisella adeliensis]MBK2096590.1 LysR family transcriptional regulator [Francisella adeliensis]QIW12892.1 LysR family transcriptional regulator [Francisella adeliensis]QIW14768.1 LysR family transcriptional regulator [Francisella adeliensis]
MSQSQISKDIIEGTRYFVRLVEQGSYSAVKNYYLVELNTIKAKIEILEKYLNIKLIQNIQNKISATTNGMKYYYSCSQLLKEFENTISSIKHNGFKEKPSLKILGSPIFIQNMIDEVIPSLEELGVQNCNYILNDYLLDSLSGFEYQLDKYDVIQLYTKHLDYIASDDWIVCSTLDSANIKAKIYASNDFIKRNDLNEGINNLQNMPLIFNNYDFTYRILNYIHNDKKYDFAFDNVKYVVDNQLHKTKLIQKGLGIGFMPTIHAESQSLQEKNISAIDNVDAFFYIEPQLILINKNSKFLKELVNTIRPVVKSWIDKASLIDDKTYKQA